MKTSKKGLDLIKKWEGCRLKPYKCFRTEKYYTVGYGHYGADVTPHVTITQKKADELLKKDLVRFEKAVNSIEVIKTQNAFDALVSFTYNCGENNLRKLCENRTLQEISEKIVLYNKSNGVFVQGLYNRRLEEQKFIKRDLQVNVDLFYPKVIVATTSIVDTLKKIGVDSSFTNRKKIARNNGIMNYTGTPTQNLKMLSMLKNGCLKK